MLQSKLLKVIGGVQPTQLKEMMLRIFNDFVRIIGYLSLVETKLQSSFTRDEIVQLFWTVEGEALYIIQYIQDQLPNIQKNTSLATVLDSIMFAIDHELARIFELELARLDTDNEELRNRLMDAHELLLNCFQQCIIILARVFDPTLAVHTLFNDLEDRIHKSQILQEDLSNILFLARHVELDRSEFALTLFKDRLFDFHFGSRRYLQQQDWRMFDDFLNMYERLETDDEFKQFLGRFVCYIELLLDHVQKRNSRN